MFNSELCVGNGLALRNVSLKGVCKLQCACVLPRHLIMGAGIPQPMCRRWMYVGQRPNESSENTLAMPYAGRGGQGRRALAISELFHQMPKTVAGGGNASVEGRGL